MSGPSGLERRDLRTPIGSLSAQKIVAAIDAAYGGGDASSLQGTPVSAVAPVLGQSLVYNGVQWAPSTPAGGGDVVGPAGATDNAVARYDLATGKLIQNSLVLITDLGSITLPAAQTVDGRDVSVDGAALDSHIANTANPHATTAAQVGAPPTGRTLTAGAGLTGGGDLSADRTFDVVANADGSITVNANDVQVGVLATDAQHGARGGGTQHAVVVPAGANGFMSGSDKSKLDGVATGAAAITAAAPVNVTKAAAAVGVATDAARADHKHDITTAAATTIGTANSEGVATSLARSDHGHDHGAQTSGALHAAATTGVAGFLSAADKTRLDALAAVLGFGNSGVAATTTTRYLSPWYEGSTAGTAAIAYRVTRAGTLRRLQIQHNTGAGNGNAIVYTVRVNGVASALTVSIASTATTAEDNVNTVAVASGDRIDIEVTKAASVGASPTDILATLELT